MKKLESFNNWAIKKNAYKESANDGNEMLKNNLNDIIEYATELMSVVNESSDLDAWMEDKITVARTYMSDVTHAYMNDLKNKSSCGKSLDQMVIGHPMN